jgi:hypothetical protein
MNTWSIVDGDIVLSSEDQEQMEFANAWILNLVQAIRLQVIEELQNGRTDISDDTKGTNSEEDSGNPSEVPC